MESTTNPFRYGKCTLLPVPQFVSLYYFLKSAAEQKIIVKILQNIYLKRLCVFIDCSTLVIKWPSLIGLIFKTRIILCIHGPFYEIEILSPSISLPAISSNLFTGDLA